MPRRFMHRFAGPLYALLITAVPADGQGTTAAQLRELDAYTTDGLREWEIPGLTVTIVRNDSVLLTKGYGVRRLGASDAVAAQTEVGIISTTKAIAVLAMGMLVENGKLSGNDPITTHCPALQLQDPILTREATEKDLLTHYIGMGNADLLRARGDLTAPEILRRVRYLPAAYSLRGGFAYQNVRFGAAGELIARVLYRGMHDADENAVALTAAKRVAGTKPSLSRASSAGSCTHPAWGDLIVTTDGTGLRVTLGASAANTGTMQHWQVHIFRSELGGGPGGVSAIVFQLDATGAVTRVLFEGSDTYTFTRVPLRTGGGWGRCAQTRLIPDQKSPGSSPGGAIRYGTTTYGTPR